MPLDKNMSHQDMVQELMLSYKKTGKIGATKPRDKKHALEIANAVAYNIGESKEIKIIERKVKEMNLDEILNSMEKIVSAKEKELGLSETYGQENPKVKVTLDSGETFETEVDPATSEDDLEKQYKTGTEINVGKEGQERKARIKSATLTKQVGESFEDARNTLSKYFDNAKDIMGTLKNQGEDPNETLDIISRLVKKAGYKLYDEGDNNYVMDKDDNAIINFYVDDDERIKFNELDLDENNEEKEMVIKNPTNVVAMDIPLLLRILEWAREDSTRDEDLHFLTENLIEAMNDTEFLSMSDYDSVIPCYECDYEPLDLEDQEDIFYADEDDEPFNDDEEEPMGESLNVEAMLNNNFGKVPPSFNAKAYFNFAKENLDKVLNPDAKQFGGIASGKYYKLLEEYKKLKNKSGILTPNEVKKNIQILTKMIEDSQYELNNADNETLKYSLVNEIVGCINDIQMLSDWFVLSKHEPKYFDSIWKKYYSQHPEDFTENLCKELPECDGSCATTSSDMGADQVLPFGKKNKVKKLKNKKSNRTVKNETYNIPSYPIGKNDLIDLATEMTVQGKSYSEAIDEIADLIFDGKIELTGTLSHGLKKLNKFKRDNDKGGFEDYLQQVSKTWFNQAVGRLPR